MTLSERMAEEARDAFPKLRAARRRRRLLVATAAPIFFLAREDAIIARRRRAIRCYLITGIYAETLGHLWQLLQQHQRQAP